MIRPAAWSRDSGGSNGIVRAGPSERSERHGFHHGLADGAVLSKQRLGYLQVADLGSVGVGDKSAEERLRGTWHVGEAVGQRAACAGLRSRQREAPFREGVHHGFLQGVPILGVKKRPDGFHNERLGSGQLGAGSDQSEVYLPRTCAVSDLQAEAQKRLAQTLLDHRLAQTADSVRPDFHVWLQRQDFPENGKYAFNDHRLQFTRWPWQQKKVW